MAPRPDAILTVVRAHQGEEAPGARRLKPPAEPCSGRTCAARSSVRGSRAANLHPCRSPRPHRLIWVRALRARRPRPASAQQERAGRRRKEHHLTGLDYPVKENAGKSRRALNPGG
jgi:hypothetical protein